MAETVPGVMRNLCFDHLEDGTKTLVIRITVQSDATRSSLSDREIQATLKAAETLLLGHHQVYIPFGEQRIIEE